MVFYIIIGFFVGLIAGWYISTKNKKHQKQPTPTQHITLDLLTGLPNRMEFFKHLKKAKGVILIDLDDFSIINNVYSKEIGDAILQKISKKISNIEHIDNLYRMGGDEFAVIFEEEKDLKEIANVILQVIDDFYIKKDNILIQVGATIAISYTKPFIETADLALKYGKKKKLNIVVYSENLGLFEEDEAFLDVIRRLKIAIKENKVIPFFQCIKDNNGDIAQYEALIRIQEGDKFVPPAVFLDIAKRTKIYPELTAIMVQKTFLYMKNKQVNFSINFSYDDILNHRIYKFILDEINRFPDPRRIIVEFVETEAIENFDYIKNFIDTIRQKGCKIAIDDFGSGYNNFTYLEKLKPDIVKIDGSLIQTLLSSDNSSFLVQTIIDFCQKNGIISVAEYVSHREIYMALKEMGVDEYQGFYFCKPAKEIK